MMNVKGVFTAMLVSTLIASVAHAAGDLAKATGQSEH